MTVVGVTGTNGKTSTVQLLTQAWNARGIVSGSVGTLGAGLYGHIVPTGFTTPLVLQTHELLAHMREDGAQAIAMEASSHALDQGRVDGVHFDVARVHQPHSRPPGLSRRHGDLRRGQGAPVRVAGPAGRR